MRTLVIASAASATAAALVSQLWIAGTWIAAAVTPVIVALVSELLHRPSERLARAITSDRPALVLDDPDERPADAPRPDPDAPRPAAAGPVRVYRQPVARRASRPRVAIGLVAATAAIALVVAVAVLSVTELIAGQSIGRGGDSASTLFGGTSRKQRDRDREQQAPAATTGETATEEQPPATTPAEEEQPPATTPTAPTTTPTAPAAPLTGETAP